MIFQDFQQKIDFQKISSNLIKISSEVDFV